VPRGTGKPVWFDEAHVQLFSQTLAKWATLHTRTTARFEKLVIERLKKVKETIAKPAIAFCAGAKADFENTLKRTLDRVNKCLVKECLCV